MINKNTFQGFTLLEILIVVVILAGLASVVIPRMLGQVDRAKTAEAFQLMGAIRKAASRRFDLEGGSVGYISSAPSQPTTGNWNVLGLQDLGSSKNWSCSYSDVPEADGSISYDILVNDASFTNQLHLMVTRASEEEWECLGVFKPLKNSNNKVIGCTV